MTEPSSDPPSEASGPSRVGAASLRIDRSARPRRRGAGPIPWIAGIAIASVVGVVAYQFLGKAFGVVSGVEVRETRALRVSADAASERTTASGYVVARVKAAISSREPGKLIRLLVDVGDRVEAGALLAELDHAELDAMVERWRAEADRTRADLAVAEAAAAERESATRRAGKDTATARAARDEAAAWLDEARREAARQEELLRSAVATVTERDRAVTEARLAESRLARAAAAVASAEAEEERAARDAATFAARVASSRAVVASMEASLKEGVARREDSYIRAPFAGVVLRKEADVGEVIAPVTRSGSTTRGAVVTLADFSSLEMEVDVFERDVSRVEAGAPARIVLDAYPREPYAGKVRQVVPTADRTKATVQVKVTFDAADGRVLPEMGGKVVFLAAGTVAKGGAERITVPAASLVDRSGRRGVFVIERGTDADRVRWVPVEATVEGSSAVVASGLAGGERIVAEAPPALVDGATVKVLP
jgi:HlyD family secretion protein